MIEFSNRSIRCVGADHQAQQESYIEIHQNYPINSRNMNNNEARKLKYCMKPDR